MANPSVNELMLPTLRLLADGEAHHLDEGVAMAHQHINLSVANIRATLESGN